MQDDTAGGRADDAAGSGQPDPTGGGQADTVGGRTALAVGAGLTLLGVVGYVVGVATPYPGRAFSVTGVMIGVALLAIGNAQRATEGP